MPRVVRYIVSGSAALAVHLCVLVTLVEVFKIRPSIGTSIGFCAALIVNYMVQLRWVFAAEGAHHVLFTRYVMVTLATFVLNILLFRFAHEGLGLWYPLAQVMTTGIIFFVNFTINSKYTFRSAT